MRVITANHGRGIVHDAQRQCFIAYCGQSEALLEYVLLAKNSINFHHTFVPESMRGRGIAEALVKTGLAWAQQHNLRVEASCWYVRRLLHN